MPVPVFEQPIEDQKPKIHITENRKVSGVAAFFSIILVIMLVFTMELLLRDVNKVFNDQYGVCYKSRNIITLFQPQTATEMCNPKTYEGIKLLLHADVIVPVALISLLILYIYINKKFSPSIRMLRNAYMFFVIWILIRIVYETEYFLFKHHELLGKYLVLLTLIILLVFLVVYLQKKFQKRPL